MNKLIILLKQLNIIDQVSILMHANLKKLLYIKIMNIVFELIPIIITVFLIFKGNKIKEYLLNLSIENKLEKNLKM